MISQMTFKGHDGGGWNIDLGEYERFSLQGANFIDDIIVGAWNQSSHRTDNMKSADLCRPNHMRNCQYASKTQIKLMGGSVVTLIPANVSQADCTLRISFQNLSYDTALSNVRFFAFDGLDINNPPEDIIVCAFERTASVINIDRFSDAPGDGGAWDEGKGIGGAANALICSPHVSASIHYFYIGLSWKPTSPADTKPNRAIAVKLNFNVN